MLEVGCGVNPLCCLAALRHSCKYIATDGSLQALQGLVRNLDLNCRCVSHASKKAGRHLIHSPWQAWQSYWNICNVDHYEVVVCNMCHQGLCCDLVMQILTVS